jgi:hypothetical protein
VSKYEQTDCKRVVILPYRKREFMKALFWIGTLLLVLGIASFFVPITHHEREGFKAGGASIGIETQHQETVSPIISGAMILAGAGLMIAAKRNRASN